MIRISCSMLERVRKNPTVYAHELAMAEKSSGRGTHGMFAYWQDTVKLLNTGELNLNEGLKELQNKFVRFNENSKNKKKQENLIEQFIRYNRVYDKMNFEFVNSRKIIKWKLSSQCMLTGLTPWVVKNTRSYYLYFFTEKKTAWNKELKYPLILEYLSKNILNCKFSELHIGIYCLETSEFEFKKYSQFEINNAVIELKQIFSTVENEFNKKKNSNNEFPSNVKI